MALPQRNWTISLNNAFSTAVDQPTQYREAVFAWKTLMVAAGWSVVRSSDGASGAGGGDNVGAGDNWSTAAGLGVETTASGGAWIVFEAPASFMAAGGSLFIIGAINDGAANPQIFQIQGSTETYTGGTTTALPTTTGIESPVNAGADDILGYSSPVAANYHTWRSDRGDVMFFTKRQGIDEMDVMLICYSNEDGDGGGSGEYRAIFGQSSSTLFGTNTFPAGLRGVNAAGTSSVSGLDFTSVLSTVSGADVDYLGGVISTEIRIIQDVFQEVRDIGELVDWWAAPNAGTVASLWGRTIDEEAAQAQRRVAVGRLYLFAPTASLPFV